MKVQTKIMLLITAVIGAVVSGMILALLTIEQRQIQRQEKDHLASIVTGISRTAEESLNSHDDLMLLSYLRFQMKESPEMEVCSVTKNNYTTTLGKAKDELAYMTAKAAAGKETVEVTVGFSKSTWEKNLKRAAVNLTMLVLGIALVGLSLGLVGAWWISRSIARPIAELAYAAEKLGEGDLGTVVNVRGSGEVTKLGTAFNTMAASIRESITAKEDLMSTLTHELSNPLAGLKAFIKLLHEPRHPYTNDEAHQVYETMAEAVGQMELTLTDALELFKTSSAKLSLRSETVNICAIARDVINLYSPVARSNNINLKLAAPEHGLELVADCRLLRNVMINLISNAIKYTPEHGEINVKIEDKNNDVEFSVADTGYGISEEDQKMLFTKFYRAHDADGRKEKIPGTGLGLAIAHQTVALHHGKIWVESEKNKGSTFRVLLPKSGSGELL